MKSNMKALTKEQYEKIKNEIDGNFHRVDSSYLLSILEKDFGIGLEQTGTDFSFWERGYGQDENIASFDNFNDMFSFLVKFKSKLYKDKFKAELAKNVIVEMLKDKGIPVEDFYVPIGYMICYKPNNSIWIEISRDIIRTDDFKEFEGYSIKNIEAVVKHFFGSVKNDMRYRGLYKGQ